MIAQLANELESIYPDLNFRNHCYLRIAYDNAVYCKWDTVVDKPFTKNGSLEQRYIAELFLKTYKTDKKLLLEHNKISLTYRKKL
jgi:hypothetical protein